MAIRSYSILALLIFCTCCMKYCTAAPEETPKSMDSQTSVILSIEFNKAIYAVGESIITTLSVRNVGNIPKTAEWLSMGGECLLYLENEEGNSILMPALHADTAHPTFVFAEPLNPGQAYSTTFDLTRLDISGSSLLFPRLAWMPAVRRTRIDRYVVGPGTYKLKAIQVVDVPHDPKYPATLIEGARSFIIREPNIREKEALNLFELQPFFASEQDKDSRKANAHQSQLDTITAFDKVWNNYRDTVYAPYALYYAARISQKMGDNSGAVSRYTTLEKSCRDFPLMADLLYYKTIALRDAGNKYEAMVVAQKLKDRYWNHLVAPTIETRRKGSPLRNMITDLEAVTSGAFKSMFASDMEQPYLKK